MSGNKEMSEVDILKLNVRELQEQLQNAYKRIEELNNEKGTCFCGVCGAGYVGYYPGDLTTDGKVMPE